MGSLLRVSLPWSQGVAQLHSHLKFGVLFQAHSYHWHNPLPCRMIYPSLLVNEVPIFLLAVGQGSLLVLECGVCDKSFAHAPSNSAVENLFNVKVLSHFKSLWLLHPVRENSLLLKESCDYLRPTHNDFPILRSTD